MNIQIILKENPRKILFIFTLSMFILIDFLGTKTFQSLYPGPWKERVLSVLGTQDSTFHHTFKPNGTYKSKRYDVFTNSLGFKDSKVRDINLAKKGKILFLGDSFTEGVWLSWEDTFVGMISDSLIKHDIEVLNGGVSSYSPIIYWKKIKYLFEDIGLKVDELIVYVDLSDLYDEIKYWEEYRKNTKTFFKEDDIKKSTNNHINLKKKSIKDLIAIFLKHNFLFFYNFIDFVHDSIFWFIFDGEISLFDAVKKKPWWLDKNHFPSNWPLKTDNNWEERISKGKNLMEESMDNIVDLCNKKNIRLTIAVYPWPNQIAFNDFNSLNVEIWENYCIKNNLIFLNLYPSFFKPNMKKIKRASIIKSNYIERDFHFNKNGHRVIADHFINQFFKE